MLKHKIQKKSALQFYIQTEFRQSQNFALSFGYKFVAIYYSYEAQYKSNKGTSKLGVFIPERPL